MVMTLLIKIITNTPLWCNYATLGNCGILSVDPQMIAISSQKGPRTNKGIRLEKAFSVNIPSADMAAAVDWCGLVSGDAVDKSQVIGSFMGAEVPVPMAEQRPVNLACRAIKEFELYGMEVFVGEIAETYVTSELLSNGSRIPRQSIH
jgi:flavin reductase (DIM6/NTAB) family NADH-FMN oxidoreductase RutF